MTNSSNGDSISRLVRAERGLRARIRGSLGEWAKVALASHGMVPARHHRLVISELEGLAAGRFDRLMLLLPPGSAKSTYTFQDNWTGFDITVPQASVIEWVGTWGGWQAVSFPLSDYLAPSGDGGVALRSLVGDVVLRPGGTGQLRVASDGEPLGYASHLGRGSPDGVVSAPAGSDYRNLDGGTGSTMWVKRSGSGAVGWAAIG